MSALRLFIGNRLEDLVKDLAGVIGTPLASPFDEEIIVVQSKGMDSWVSMALARYHGICANVSFPFPNAFINRILIKAFPEIVEPSPFDPDIMTWKIMDLLPTCLQRSGFESLNTYLAEEDDLKLFQLAQRIADTFDQYLLFRPDMMLQWEKGKKADWQAVLWRELVKSSTGRHRAALGKALIGLLRDPSTRIETLPQRVSVFGISALPPFHMQVFDSLSRFTQVNLFLMNPCMEYWGDISSDYELKKTLAGDHIPQPDLHLVRGNSLLASMGTMGRDFFDLINEFECEISDSFVEPGEETLLACIQSDILHLREGPHGTVVKRVISEHDSSVRIHSCHSPMREVEALRDELLEMFERDPNLKPRDILVMTPDIETYAPYIQAVFDIPMSDGAWIPFSIADRSIRSECKIVAGFMAILRLLEGRFGASQVLSILESQAIQRKFGISEADLPLITGWVEETGIRWGIDAMDRQEMGLPAISENTWRAGLNRLLLGYSMSGRGQKMFLDMLPNDKMEGSETVVLGGFLDFVEQLFSQVESLKRPRTIREWSSILGQMLEIFFEADEETEHEIHVIRNLLHDLADAGVRAGFNGKIDIRVIQCHLEQHLKREGLGFGFITGGVTFCAILPMRSIPFKNICLMGMNVDAFPRQSRQLSFDLMAKAPKKGDRSRRNDDRYLFLEAILSAREKLYISYVGQNIEDNSLVPPSVLVSELLDVVNQGFYIKGKKILDHVVTKHRLQPFSPEYFKEESRLFSYSAENLAMAQRLVEPRVAPEAFVSKGISEPTEEWKTVDVSDLCHFFNNPARFLLNQRLGVYLDESTSILQDTEPFHLAGLDRYLLAQDMVKWRLAGQDPKESFHLATAAGLLPHGTVGRCLYDRLNKEIEEFVEMIQPHVQGNPLKPLDIDLEVSGYRLVGIIDHIYPERLVQYRYAQIKAKDRLAMWISHLIMNCLKPMGYPLNSMVIGMEPLISAWEYPPLENCREILEQLLAKYWEGLVKPLHFFPETSWAYTQMVLEKRKHTLDALQGAGRIWAGNDYARGENEDPYYQRCFADIDPLGASFEETSMAIFGPIMAHQRKIEEDI